MATVVLPESTRALYPFKSHYLTLSDGKRMHYVDEGPEDGDILMFVHGYPTWSFVYRALIVYYAALGFRCIAMDHIGYGLSDKPTARRYHTLKRHNDNLSECIETLNLHDITLVLEDWGVAFGLNYALRYMPNIRRLILMNSWVFPDSFDPPLNSLLDLLTRRGIGELLFGTLNLAINVGLQRLTVQRLSSSVLAGYKAPFRDVRHRTALYQFLRMIATTPAHPSTALMREIEQGIGRLAAIPTLILWGKEDSVFPPDLADHWKKVIPRAKGPVRIPAGHFLSEDNPEIMIQHMDLFLESS